MIVNAPQTNQSVEPTVNLIAVVVMWTLTAALETSVATMNVTPRSARRMTTVRLMKSVTLSTLLTTCSVSTAKMTIVCLVGTCNVETFFFLLSLSFEVNSLVF